MAEKLKIPYLKRRRKVSTRNHGCCFLLAAAIAILSGTTAAFAAVSMDPVTYPEVSEGQASFDVTVHYTAYQPDEEIRAELEDPVMMNGSRYVISNISDAVILQEKAAVPQTIEVNSSNFVGDGSSHMPDETITGENGHTYQLVSSSLVNNDAGVRTEYREVDVSYHGVEQDSDIPAERSFTLDDTATSQSIEAVLPEVSRSERNEYWSEDFTFPITITGYDADIITLNGKEIKDLSHLVDYADDFLEVLRLDPESYQITSIEWDGEAYKKDGTTCRDAVAKGNKLLYDVTVTYGGQVEFAASAENHWVSTYEEIVPEGEQTLYTLARTVTYHKTETVAEPVDTGISKKVGDIAGQVTATYETVAGIATEIATEHKVLSAIPVVLAAAVLVLLVVCRIPHRCAYDREVKCPYKRRRRGTCRSCSYYRQIGNAKRN